MTNLQLKNSRQVTDRIAALERQIWVEQNNLVRAAVTSEAAKIISWVCVAAGQPEDQVMSKSRVRELADTRKIIVQVLHSYGFTIGQIAKAMGQDRSTVMNAQKALTNVLLSSEKVRTQYATVTHFVYTSCLQAKEQEAAQLQTA